VGILTSFMKPVTEAYYGKPKEFLIIEKELDKIIQIIRKDNPKFSDLKEKINTPIKITDLNKNDSVILIEKLFKQKFGFGEFYLCFYYPMKPVLLTTPFNAFTIPRAFNFFHRDNTGSTDVSTMHVGVNIDILLVLYADLTAEEIMAVILHEIGHNMDISMFTLLSKLPLDIMLVPEFIKNGPVYIINTLMVLGIYDVFNLGGKYTNTIKLVESLLINKFPGLLRAATTFWEGYLNIMAYFKVKSFINVIKGPELIVLGALNSRNIFGYAGEKYSDSFASTYGYGPAMMSFQNKLHKRENLISDQIIYKIPLLNWGYDLLNVTLGMLTAIADPHPQDAVRINSQLDKLKRDLKDPDLNPRLRKTLEDDIESSEKFINEYYLDFNKNDNSRRIFSWMLNYMTIKVFHNMVDFRELFELVSNHEA